MKMKIDYVEIAGIKWAKMNVGAEKETDFGLYFQSGSKQGYSHPTNLCKFIKEPRNFCDSVKAYWGDKWRTPTREEFDALLSATTNEWVKNYKDSGVNGRLFTDKNDNSKTLFFPACGFCENGSVKYVGNYGYYWSSPIYDYNVRRDAWFLSFYDGGAADIYYSPRHYGHSVRGVLADK